MDNSCNEKRRGGFDRRLDRLDAYIERRAGFEKRDIVRHRQVFIEKLKITEQFLSMSEDQLYRMLLIASKVELDKGDYIINEGDAADCMYILVDGLLRVEHYGKVIGAVKPIAFVGEVAPITNNSRIATIIADSDCVLMRFSMDELTRLFESDKDLYQRFLAGIITDLTRKVQASNETIAKTKSR